MAMRDEEHARLKPRRRRLSRAALAAAGVAAVACGGKADLIQVAPTLRGQDPSADAGDGAAGAPSAEREAPDGRGEPGEPTPQWTGVAETPSIAADGSPRSDVLALGVVEMLEVYCGECHSNADNGAGFAGGLDIAALVESGMIAPGASAASPLVQRIRDGSMPPTNNRPTDGDVVLLARFIDQLRAEPAPGCDALPFLSPDETDAALLADVRSQPAGDRAFLRYVSLGYASNARLCGAALDQQRRALFKLVNSVSTATEIRVPAAIDAAQLLYRIDVRDYGWARPIDLDEDGDAEHGDGWHAIVAAAAPYAVERSGPEATALAAETGAAVPLLPGNAFVRAASTGNVYHALTGQRLNLFAMQDDLGMDLPAAIIDGLVRRGGFRRGPANVLVNRYPVSASEDRIWWSLEMQEDVFGDSNLFGDPLDVYGGNWSQTIFELPNGLFAYSMNASDGSRLGSIPRRCVDSCDRPADDAAIACFGCHSTGLVPIRDEIREYVERNALDFDAPTSTAVQRVYPPRAELDTLVAGDSASYIAALEQAGAKPELPDPISRVQLEFGSGPLDAERAAAQLGVPANALRDLLPQLSPALASLTASPAGTIERAAFESVFPETLCALHSTSRNRPAACPLTSAAVP